MDLPGKFIVIDGPDGSGKGTQLERLEAWIRQQGVECVRARDPGGTEIGDRIRHQLLDFDLAQMAPECEALLFMASRAQLVHEVIRPALNAGHCVLCDRFISATCAYQVAAGYPREDVLALGRLAVGPTWPHLTLVLDLPPEMGFDRTGGKRRQSTAHNGQTSLFDGSDADAMERRPLKFHRKVRALFRELPGVYPAPVSVVDAQCDPDQVFDDILEAVRRAFA